MAISRYRTATGAGTLVALLLVLIGGSPMYVRWVNAGTDASTAGGWFMRQFAWPAWSFDEDQSVQDAFATALKAILVVAFTALFLMLLTGSQLASARGGISQLLAGWGAFIFAAALAGLVSAFVFAGPTLLNAFQQAGGGAVYGLFVGWLVGAAALGGRRP